MNKNAKATCWILTLPLCNFSLSNKKRELDILSEPETIIIPTFKIFHDKKSFQTLLKLFTHTLTNL